MSYAADISDALAKTLTRIASVGPHQLAGHAANLDFWLSEVRHCAGVIDGYNKRFDAMTAAQYHYVAAHGTLEYNIAIQDYCQSPRPPRRVPHAALKGSLQALRDAAYQFLLRCYDARFIDEARLREAADSIATGVDVRDLRR